MPKLSEYQLKKVYALKRKAVRLYKRGLTTRQVGALVHKSRTWVSQAVRELSTDIKVDKS